MTTQELLELRLRNQRLHGAGFGTAAQAVDWLGAVQSQDFAGAKWALALRMKAGAREADIDAAFDRGDILRTHVLRPTWHFVLPKDIRWMLELSAPHINKAMSYYDRKLGLSEAVYKRTNAVIARALRGGVFKTREELSKELVGAGFKDAVGQKLGHIVMRAETDGLMCSGPRRGKQFTYALLSTRAPNARTMKRNDALDELAMRYFGSRGPATVKDFAWWSGLPMADCRQAVTSAGRKLTDVEVEGVNYIMFANAPSSARRGAPRAFLLSNYDEYGIAYADRGAMISKKDEKALGTRGNAVFAHMVVCDGKGVGMWRRSQTKDGIAATVRGFRPLKRDEKTAIADAAERYAAFLGRPVTVTFARQ